MTQATRIAALEAWRKAHEAEHQAHPLHDHPVEPPPDPPPPDPGTRPFPAPVTTGTIATNNVDTIGSAPSGSLIEVTADMTVTKGILLQGKSNIIIDGKGKTIRLNTPGGNSDPSARASAFMLKDCHDIAIRNFNIIGNNPDTTNIFVPGNEGQHVLSLNGWYSTPPSYNVEVSGVTASHIYCDFAYLEGRNGVDFAPSHHVWLHHNTTSYIGRNQVSSISVNDLLVEDNTFDKVGGAPWDIEPNYAAEQVRRNTFRRNKVGSYGHMKQFTGWFVVVAYVNDTPVETIVVDDNDVVGIAVSPNDGTARGLNTKVLGKYTGGGQPVKGFRFTNNRTAQAAAGPILYCANGSQVTQSGNVQPLLSGPFTNC